MPNRYQALDEFLALPEEKPALEYWRGRVSQKVSPKARHSALQGELMQRFNQVGMPRRVARAFPELRATFAGESVVPDVAVYRWERIQREKDGSLADDVTTPPDIAVEIVSPGQSANALMDRCLWYVAHGVQVALLADPYHQSVLVVRPERQPVLWRGADLIDVSEVLPGFDLSVEQLFSSLRQA